MWSKSETEEQQIVLKLFLSNSLSTLSSEHQSASMISEDQIIKDKLDLQLYLHFQRMLPRSKQHYNSTISFFGKKASKQNVVKQTLIYYTLFLTNLKTLPPDHHKQLLFLLQIFNIKNLLISNHYNPRRYNTSPNGQRLLQLHFYGIQKIEELERFLGFDNWWHIYSLSFWGCRWFDNDAWKILVQNAGNFKNVRWIYLNDNRITDITQADILKFKSLEIIHLWCNPLTQQTKDALRILRHKSSRLEIHF